MSLDEFKKAYYNADIKKLRKYIKYDKILSVPKFVNYVEKSFIINRDVYDVLVLILFNKYDLNEVVRNIIGRDNTELLEHVLDNNYQIELDENLIYLTGSKGRVSMAKSIYEYIHGEKNSYKNIVKVLKKYPFMYNKDENSIDSYVLALHKREFDDIDRISHYINLGFWDNFAIKYVSYNYDQCIYYNTKNILLSAEIDPGVDDDLPLRTALKKKDYVSANELLKHPLVSVYFTDKFIMYLIENNCLYVAERILRTENDNAISVFKHVINNVISCHNDVTYLAIKLGIFDVDKLMEDFDSDKRKIKKYLANFKISDEFILKPYEPDLDPHDVCKLSFQNNDILLAESIVDYSISVDIFFFLKCLIAHRNDKYTDVYNYILDEKIKQFDPTDLLYWLAYLALWHKSDVDRVFEKILAIVKDNPKLKYKMVYDECVRCNCQASLMRSAIKEKCSKKKFKEICGK